MKKLFIILLLLLVSAGLFAEDDGFSSFDNGLTTESEDGFSSDSDEGFGGDFGSDFGSDFGDSGNASVDVTGELNGGIILYPDYDELAASIIEYGTSLNMNLSYAGSNSDVVVSLNVDEHLTDEEIKLYDVIDEAYVRWYAGPVDIELGLIKNIWGKGDEIHVVDVLNPSDNRSFMAGSYLDRKLAVPMLNTAFKGGDFGTLELTYIPYYTPAAQAMSGRWRQLQSYELEAEIGAQLNSFAQAQIGALIPSIMSDGTTDLATATAIATSTVMVQMAEIQNNVQQYEQTITLEYGQFGVRYSLYAGGFDLGIMYYYGFFDEPAIDKSQLGTLNQVFIKYDRMQMFGLDGAGVLGPLNLRAEAAFYLSEDIEGDDPLVHNNRIAYLFGFDFKPGISSLDVNIQATGAITLNTADLTAADIEYDADDSYQTHLLSASIADTYLNDKLEIRVTGAWLVSTEDYLLQPEVTYKPDDNLSVGIRYSSYNGPADGIFGQFKDNSALELSASYSF